MTQGLSGRCADCKSLKTCGHVRVNKYARKPCTGYCADLRKLSRLQKMQSDWKKRNGNNHVRLRASHA